MKRVSILCLILSFMIFTLPSLWAQEKPIEYVKGMRLCKEGKYQEAREELKKFLELYPNSSLAPGAHFKMAEATEDLWEAAQVYRNLTLRYPDSSFAPQAQFRIGEYYYLKGDYEQTLKDHQRLLELYPQSAYAAASQYWVGNILLARKKYGEARKEFEKVLDKYPQSNYLDWAQIGIGDSYAREGNCSRALIEYQKVIENYPESEILNLVYFNLGGCYEKGGKDKKALEAYEKLIITCPLSLEATKAQKRINALQKKFIPIGGKYGVQVGAFSEQNRAEGLVKRLKNDGYDAYIMTINIEGKQFHRVRVGRLATEIEAQKLAKRLKDKEKLPVRIFSD